MNLTIFPPLGGSLTDLEKSGQLNRFKTYYLNKYKKNFSKVFLISYKTGIHRYLWQFIIPFKYRRELQGSILRVLQLNGMLPALISKLTNGGKMAVTYGFDYKKFAFLDRKYIEGILFMVFDYVFLGLADLIIAPNREIFNKLAKRESINKKIVYLPNGVDIKLFTPDLSEKKQKNKTIRLLSIGRLEKQKNYEFLIKVIANSIHRSRINLTLIGHGFVKDNIISIAKNKHVSLQIIDSVPFQKLPGFYQSSDIYVQPSLIEGSPKTLLEAMSCGCCVLASNVSGNSEVINSGVDGLLADLNLDDFKRELEKLISDKEFRNQLGNSARLTIKRKFEINSIIQTETKLLKILK